MNDSQIIKQSLRERLDDVGNDEKYNVNLRMAISDVLNRFSAENGCDTPDYILARYLVDCLRAFDRAVLLRRIQSGEEHEDQP